MTDICCRSSLLHRRKTDIGCEKKKKSSAVPIAIDLKSSSSIDYAISTCAVSIQGIASFVPLAEAAGICIVVSEKILRRAEDADYIDDRIVERLSFRNTAPEVSSYMFMSGRRPLFSDVMAAGVPLFFWTTTDGDGGGGAGQDEDSSVAAAVADGKIAFNC